MTMTLKQKVQFDLPPNKLYKFYMDAELHGKLTDGKVKISKEPGSAFSAWSGALKGKTLYTKPNSVIAQTWRAKDWNKATSDSILVLMFHESETGTELEMVHTNLPEKHADDVKQGWKQYYWKPWKKHIQTRASRT